MYSPRTRMELSMCSVQNVSSLFFATRTIHSAKPLQGHNFNVNTPRLPRVSPTHSRADGPSTDSIDDRSCLGVFPPILLHGEGTQLLRQLPCYRIPRSPSVSHCRKAHPVPLPPPSALFGADYDDYIALCAAPHLRLQRWQTSWLFLWENQLTVRIQWYAPE